MLKRLWCRRTGATGVAMTVFPLKGATGEHCGAMAVLWEDLLAACAEFAVEGLMLKRLRSICLPGRRSTGWRKIKTPDWVALHAQRRRPA